MPFFFISSLIVLFFTLIINCALRPEKAKKFASWLRLPLFSFIIFGSRYDIYRHQITSGALLTFMCSILVCIGFFSMDVPRYWKGKEDPEIVNSVLKNAVGYIGFLLALNLFGVYMHYVEMGLAITI